MVRGRDPCNTVLRSSACDDPLPKAETYRETRGGAEVGKHTFYTWSGIVKASGSVPALVTLYAGAGSAGTYYIATAILAHPAASAKALRGILDSVTIR